MELSTQGELIVCKMALFTLVADIVLLVLGCIILDSYRKLRRGKLVIHGVKEKPKKPKGLDKAEVADKKRKALDARVKGYR